MKWASPAPACFSFLIGIVGVKGPFRRQSLNQKGWKPWCTAGGENTRTTALSGLSACLFGVYYPHAPRPRRGFSRPKMSAPRSLKVHLTLGSLRKSQAVSPALAFFWLDGFAVPAPAQVTQTVGLFLAQQSKAKYK